MSGPVKEAALTRALVQVLGAAVVFVVVVGLGRSVFVHGLKAAPEPPTASAIGAAAPPTQVSEGGITLTSVSLDVPEDDSQFPAGPHVDAVNSVCAACHSPSMVLTQPRLTEDQWKATVEKMRDSYKAPVSDKDAPMIIDYLTSLSTKLPTAGQGAAGANG
jgi:hypothetical protein